MLRRAFAAAAAATGRGALGRLSSASNARNFNSSRPVSAGFDDFFDAKLKPGEMLVTGRAWTVDDLRRKSFDDLHKLWFVLYKERNLLLSEREKTRRMLRPLAKPDENRYMKVKKSMAGIKVVLNERKRIERMLEKSASASASASAAEEPGAGGSKTTVTSIKP